MLQHRPELRTYVYPGFIFWAFDRFSRLARLVVLNTLSLPRVSDAKNFSTIERISNDTVRLSVRRSKNALTSWRAGQHFFIIIPGVSALPWEAHPFTPATIANKAGIDSDGSGDRTVQLDFIIRGRGGFTGHLLRRASEGGGQPISDMILVDGPYGQPPELGIFDTAILIAGL